MPKKIKTQPIKLLEFQAEFVNDMNTPYIALVGGLGTGKTTAACYKIFKLFQENRGYDGIGCEPTGPQLSIFTTEMDKTCRKHGIKFEYRGQGGGSPAFYRFDFGWGPQKLTLVSAKNYKASLIGYNVAFGFVDEFDTIENKQEAIEIWQHLTDRIRVGPRQQAFVTTTPEGYRQVAEIFAEEISQEGVVLKARPNHRVIQVATTENIHLRPSYIERQLSKFSPLQAQAKIYGRFVNAFGYRVYDTFVRERNRTDLTLADFPRESILHIGMDFNVGAMSAVTSVVRDGRVYAVDEIVGVENTTAMIAEIKRRYPGRVIYIYPDASGVQRTASANGPSQSSIAQLQAAGFQTFYRGRNPSIVKERVPAVCAMFYNAAGEVRAFVNTKTCPTLTKGLEQQGWVDGRPDKNISIEYQGRQIGLDHPLDAFGYFIHFRFPVTGTGTMQVYR